MAKRPKIPTSVQTAVLTESRRRCCLCFHLDGDDSEKPGQIAHLDHDPTNNAEDNLAWLCLPHHDRYDSRTSQSKGLTIEEAKGARRSLYWHVGSTIPLDGPTGRPGPISSASNTTKQAASPSSTKVHREALIEDYSHCIQVGTRDLDQYVPVQLNKIEEAIASQDDTDLLNLEPEEYVASLLNKYRCAFPTIRFDTPRKYTPHGATQTVTWRLPYSGSSQPLRYKPNDLTLYPSTIQAEPCPPDGTLFFEVPIETDVPSDRHLVTALDSLRAYEQRMKAELDKLNRTLEQEATDALSRRRSPLERMQRGLAKHGAHPAGYDASDRPTGDSEHQDNGTKVHRHSQPDAGGEAAYSNSFLSIRLCSEHWKPTGETKLTVPEQRIQFWIAVRPIHPVLIHSFQVRIDDKLNEDTTDWRMCYENLEGTFALEHPSPESTPSENPNDNRGTTFFRFRQPYMTQPGEEILLRGRAESRKRWCGTWKGWLNLSFKMDVAQESRVALPVEVTFLKTN